MGARPSSFTFTSAGPYRLYNTAELLSLPTPDWLIEQMIPEGALASLYGPPESTKSFMAIDLAMCVATGTPWHGHAVQQGFVLYVAAEGGPSISKRVRAWLQTHDMPVKRAHIGWLIEPIAIHSTSADLDTLMNRIDHEIDRAPVLVIIDTLARCFDGDENQQEDMGEFIAGMGRLRKEYGAAILAVHHTNLSGERERGSTALRGGTDTMLAVTHNHKTKETTLTCSKQKDSDRFEPLIFELEPVEGVNSCVLVSVEDVRLAKTAQILQILKDLGPLEWEVWRSSADIPKSTFQGYFSELRKTGQIIKENTKWRAVAP